uniref:Retroviral nucleocapsid Gag protein p24 C-terminal domain-containing protein n=1 Tax=Monodelphis domestica TaxID=13616 RepID=A0A5F8GVQ9_MONDO
MGTLEVAQWDLIGQSLKDYQKEGNRVRKTVFNTWSIIRTILEDLAIRTSNAGEKESPQTQEFKKQDLKRTAPEETDGGREGECSGWSGDPPEAPGYNSKESKTKESFTTPRLYPSLNTLTPPPPTPPPDYGLASRASLVATPPPPCSPEVSKPDSLRNEPISPTQKGKEDISAFPVRYIEDREDANRRIAQHKPIDCKVLKMLRSSVLKNGAIAPFTLALLSNLTQQTLTPADWYLAAESALSGGDYLTWKLKFHDLCSLQASENRQAGINVPFEQLVGQGEFEPIARQIAATEQVFNQIASAATKAWRALPGKDSESLYTEIIQKQNESFADFVDRLSTEVRRHIPHEDAAKVLIRDLAFLNANEQARRALAPIKATGTLTDFLRACQDIGMGETRTI